MSVSATTVKATPTRDRLPFPPSQNQSPNVPVRTTASSSASSNSLLAGPAASMPPTQSVSIDSLLALHSNAPNPVLAALEQAVHDRNSFSSQNSQLWKLIEKQRAGYNQILKELERVRTERETYKNKLAVRTSGGQPSASGSSSRNRNEGRQRSDGDKMKNVVDKVAVVANDESSSNGDHGGNLGQDGTKHHSHNRSVPHAQDHKLHSSHSHDSMLIRDRNLQMSSNPSNSTALPLFPSSSVPVTDEPTSTSLSSMQPTQQFPPPPPVPPRSESLPTSLQALSPNGDKPPLGWHRPQNSDSTATVPNAPGTKPLLFQKRQGAPETVSVVPTMLATPPHHQYHFQTRYQTTPPGTDSSTVHSSTHAQHTHHASSSNYLPEIQTQQIASQTEESHATATQTPSLQSPQPEPPSTSHPPKALLSPTSLYAVSRESRISLPDEAKQYIANMGDSPLPSPQVDAFTSKDNGNGSNPAISNRGGAKSAHPLVVNLNDDEGRGSEFLDLDDEDLDGDDEDGDEDGDDTSRYQEVQPLGPPSWIQTQAKSIQPLHIAYQKGPSMPPPQIPSQASSRKSKQRTAADDFPLPPSNAQIQAQAHAMAQAQAQAQAMAQTQVNAQTAAAMAEAAHQMQLTNVSGYPSSDTLVSVNSPYPPLLPPSSSRDLPDQPANAPSFRELPLLSTDLPRTTITVSHSFVRPNDKGKEVLSFIVFVNPGQGKDGWKVEKLYSDVLGLDGRVRSSVGKGIGKKIASLPEGKLWKDHAPAKVDQRKAVLECYLQSLVNLPLKNNDEVIAFLTSDVVRETKQPVMQAGHKEGYLTKRGKNFGGWKTRYFVLQGPVLEYYDCRGGAHSGSITVTGAKIGRQQRTNGDRSTATDDEKEYRHAFLIVEAKKGPGGYQPRHVLCAESDEDRDSWVDMLVRYYTGTYTEDPVGYGQPLASNLSVYPNRNSGATRSSSSVDLPSRRVLTRPPREDISTSKGPATPISQFPLDSNNSKLFPNAALVEDYARSSSPAKSSDTSPTDRQGPGAFSDSQAARRILDRGNGQPSSLPDSSPLSNASSTSLDAGSAALGQRANSEMGHYPDMQDNRPGHNTGWNSRQQSPEKYRNKEAHAERKSANPSLGVPASSNTADRASSPEKLDVNGKVKKISGPLNGVPIPAGYKFGGKDAPSEAASAANERREKAKSRSFWGFGRPNDKSQQSLHTPRAVFGVTLEESLEVAQIANLPAIVFRSIQYLEAKKADQEEGIYRLSGSSAVIKSLKDRFNMEGDVDLLASDEYWDPHAIAGLLKSFLRELPASILTRDLHLKFLAVIDFIDAQERIRELSQLIASLPIANYSLLRALTAHLILIVQNSATNKMTMRNVGIVFSPTLGIPAGVFSLMLGEFNRVFNVNSDNDEVENPVNDIGSEDGLNHTLAVDRRNSRQYSDAAADQLLGLSGRTLPTPAEEGQSDDEYSLQDESGTETTDGDGTVESYVESSTSFRASTPETPVAPKASKASTAAMTRGLHVAVTHSERGNRYSRMMGLPSSPRPPLSPSRPPDRPSSPIHTSKP